MDDPRPPMPESQPSTEAFPSYEVEKTPTRPKTGDTERTPGSIDRRRESSGASGSSRRRRISLKRSFLESNPPNGMWQATGEVASKAPTLNEIRNGSFSYEGWTEEGQRERRGTNPHEIQRRRLSRSSSSHNKSPTQTKGTFSSGHAPTMDALDSPKEKDEFGIPAESPSHAKLEAGGALSVIKEANQSSRAGHMKQPSQSSRNSETIKATEAVVSEKPEGDDHPTVGPDETGTYPNGYRFPPKHTWQESTVIGLKAFWKFVCTPFGFVITIYGLNVVAWGAMIFFVLLNAAPAMCHPSCNDDDSPRKKWIEVDAQVLNGLFCVTGFGLAPWRFRDFYWLMKWRVFKSREGERRLAGIYRGWYRLEGSQKLPERLSPPPVYTKKNPQTEDSPPPYSEEETKKLEENLAIPLPATSMPPPPLTGVRAQPTKPWLLDCVIWLYLWNTIFQCILCGAMWGWNRFHRPSWLVGLMISMGCVVAIAAGLVIFSAGKKVKAVEGIPVEEEEILEDVERDVDGTSRESAGGSPIEKTRSRVEKKKGRHWFERH